MRLVGDQLRSTLDAFSRPNSGRARVFRARVGDDLTPRARAIFQMVISLIVIVVASLLLLLGTSNDAQSKGAFGLIGIVLGYWLH